MGVSKARDNGRPTPRRRLAAIFSAVVDWANRITPWFAFAVLVLAALWLALAVYETLTMFRTTVGAGYAAIWGASLAGTLCLTVVCVRVAWPERGWPSDSAVRVLTTLGIVLAGFAAPLIVLTGQYGIGGVIIALMPLVVFYLRIRRSLGDILPAWCGGTWKPDRDQRTARAGQEAIRRPPRSWDETSGPGSDANAAAASRRRKKQGKKRRKSGR